MFTERAKAAEKLDEISTIHKDSEQFMKAKEHQAGTFPHEAELNEKIALQAKLNEEIQVSLEKDKSKHSTTETVLKEDEEMGFSY